MDPRRFDTIARSLAATGNRRGLVRLLAGLPLGLGLTSLLDDAPDASAEDDDHGSSHRRHRRVARHRHRPGQGNQHGKGQGKRQGCTSHSRTRTCAGKCGPVDNNCGKSVDCGPCTCTAGCPACTRCDPESGGCVADATQDGEPCGAGGSKAFCCQGGVCPTPRSGCTSAGFTGVFCDFDPAGCDAVKCCGHPTECQSISCVCPASLEGGPCESDLDCFPGEGLACICQTCQVVSP